MSVGSMPRHSQSTADDHRADCAARTGTPPVAAVCIVGAARTFASPLVQSSLRHNFVEALGCPVRLFVQLKGSDTAKELGASRMGFGVHTTTVEALRRTLRQPWLKLSRHILRIPHHPQPRARRRRPLKGINRISHWGFH